MTTITGSPRKFQWLHDYLERQSLSAIMLFGIMLVGLVGLLDFATGVELSCYVFYFIPILFVAAYAGMAAGIATAFTAAMVWLVADYNSAAVPAEPYILGWNAMVRLLSFVLVATMQHFIGRERYLARTDFLTKLANPQYFYEVAEKELSRSIRYQMPMTIAYLDLDNFKKVNDSKGHVTGNRLLRVVASTLKDNVRDVDTAARLGGDEFAIILPQADEPAAKGVMLKLQSLLNDAMQKNGWPVTFSIGVTTFHRFPATVNEMLKNVDTQMYEVKNNGKNGIRFDIISPLPEGEENHAPS